MKQSIFIIALFVLVFACQEDSNDIPDNVDVDLSETIESSIEFGLNALHTLASDPDLSSENLIISPLSIQIALYMTLNGAEGNTETEMKETLNIGGLQDNTHNQALSELIDVIKKDNETSNLLLSNGVFYDDNKLNINDDFKDRLETSYDAEFNTENFSNSATVDIINDWVKDNTQGRIEKILESIDPAEAMFLINALFFKGDWQKGFPDYGTREGDFTLDSGETIKVDMMNSDDYRLYSGGNSNYQAVDLPLFDSLYSMTFVLPPANVSAVDFINNYDALDFESFYEELYNGLNNVQRIYLAVPKFEVGSKLKLKKALQTMGMEDAFNFSQANFSDFGTANGNIFLSRVLHDTYLKIDEKGVEGSAVTAVGVAITSAPPSVRFDRSFLFFLRHIETNTLVFAGYINDPLN